GGFMRTARGRGSPGEPLPRWAFSLFWRRDGAPAWRNASRLAAEAGINAAMPDDAQAFAGQVAQRLGIAPHFVQPAYEDPVDRMVKEGELPANIDPADPKIDDPQERARIIRLLESRISQPAGFVLPVQRWTSQAAPCWISEIWRTRRGRLFLVPGDSPIGFRLPLQSLPHVEPTSYPHVIAADPFAPREPLPTPRAPAMALASVDRDRQGVELIPHVAVPQPVMRTPTASTSVPPLPSSPPVRTPP